MNDVVVSFEAADRTLLYVDIRYTIRRTNDRRNLVFPFYVIPGGNEMALPVPELDDRRFQDLVDDAKRLVQQRCPDWTDHNVSDPGVTLIELFAWMTDQLLYRLNRVPDRHYIKFLDLIGVSLFPPTAARTAVTFWLSAPQPDVVRIAPGTQVGTVRTETDESIVFASLEELPIVPSTSRSSGR